MHSSMLHMQAYDNSVFSLRPQCQIVAYTTYHMSHLEYILTLSCLDQREIIYRLSGFLADHV